MSNVSKTIIIQYLKQNGRMVPDDAVLDQAAAKVVVILRRVGWVVALVRLLCVIVIGQICAWLAGLSGVGLGFAIAIVMLTLFRGSQQIETLQRALETRAMSQHLTSLRDACPISFAGNVGLADDLFGTTTTTTLPSA